MTKVAAIETKGLCIGYLLKGGKRKVVHEDLNLQLVSGEVTCLLGLNVNITIVKITDLCK